MAQLPKQGPAHRDSSADGQVFPETPSSSWEASKGEKGRDHYLPTISQSRYTGMLGLALLS